MFTREFEAGKYTVSHKNGTEFKALRYGNEWRDLTGDGLVLVMLQEIERLDEEVANQKKQIAQFKADI